MYRVLAAAHAAADGYIGESGAGSMGCLRDSGAVATAAAHDAAQHDAAFTCRRRRARRQREPKLSRLPLRDDGALASYAA